MHAVVFETVRCHCVVMWLAFSETGSKNRYVNIYKYVDLIQLFAASSPTSVVAQLRVHCIAVLCFIGSKFFF